MNKDKIRDGAKMFFLNFPTEIQILILMNLHPQEVIQVTLIEQLKHLVSRLITPVIYDLEEMDFFSHKNKIRLAGGSKQDSNYNNSSHDIYRLCFPPKTVKSITLSQLLKDKNLHLSNDKIYLLDLTSVKAHHVLNSTVHRKLPLLLSGKRCIFIISDSRTDIHTFLNHFPQSVFLLKGKISVESTLKHISSSEVNRVYLDHSAEVSVQDYQYIKFIHKLRTISTLKVKTDNSFLIDNINYRNLHHDYLWINGRKSLSGKKYQDLIEIHGKTIRASKRVDLFDLKTVSDVHLDNTKVLTVQFPNNISQASTAHTNIMKLCLLHGDEVRIVKLYETNTPELGLKPNVYHFGHLEFPKLQNFSINLGNSTVMVAQQSQGIWKFPELKSLELKGSCNNMASVFQFLNTDITCTSFQYLSCLSIPLGTSEDKKLSTYKFPSLKSLECTYSSKTGITEIVNDKNLQYPKFTAPNLESIEFSLSDIPGDLSLIGLTEIYYPTLKSLVVRIHSSMSQIKTSKFGLSGLDGEMKNLEHLELSGIQLKRVKEFLLYDGLLSSTSFPSLKTLHHCCIANLSPKYEEYNSLGELSCSDYPYNYEVRLDAPNLEGIVFEIAASSSNSPSSISTLKSQKPLYTVSSTDMSKLGKITKLFQVKFSNLKSLRVFENRSPMVKVLIQSCAELKMIKGFPICMRDDVDDHDEPSDMFKLKSCLTHWKIVNCPEIRYVFLGFPVHLFGEILSTDMLFITDRLSFDVQFIKSFYYISDSLENSGKIKRHDDYIHDWLVNETIADFKVHLSHLLRTTDLSNYSSPRVLESCLDRLDVDGFFRHIGDKYLPGSSKICFKQASDKLADTIYTQFDIKPNVSSYDF